MSTAVYRVSPRGRWRRVLLRIIGVLWIAALIGSAALVGGAAINDRTIHSDPGRSLATVTDVGLLRTTVDFRSEDGIVSSPDTGLLYPSGLGEGQRVWVTYAKSDPNLVTVEGRRWTLSIIPALSIAAVSSLVVLAAAAGVKKATRPRNDID